MAEFSRLVITKKGQALIAKVLEGTAKDVEFTKIAASKAVYTVDELELLSALPDIMQEAPISHISRTNDVTVQVETAFSNHELVVGYAMNTLGLFAVDPDDGEILYAACAEMSGYCYMPPYNGITVSGAYIRLITTVGNAESVSLEVNPAATATFADIQRLQKQIDELAGKMMGTGLYIGDQELEGPGLWFNTGVASALNTVVFLKLGNEADDFDVREKMAAYEHSGIFSYKDENKNIHLLYPVTLKDNVKGMDKVEEDISNAQDTANAAKTAADAAKKTADDLQKTIGEGGSVIKITFEEAFVGQRYAVSDGDDTKTGTVPEGLVVSVKAVNCNSTYTIKAQANNGVTYSTTVETGAYYGQYTATLAVFTATINVTAAAGAEVKAVKDGETFTAIADGNSAATVRVNKTGNYTVTATKDGASSNSTSVEVTEETTYTAKVKFIVLTVKTPAGSRLVLKNGGEHFKEVESTTGTEVFYLPNTGTYTGEISKDDEIAESSINCEDYQDYTLELAFVHIYGVTWDGTSTTKWTRTDESALFTDPVPAVSNGTGSSPFDNLQPWAGMVKSERTGGTMVAIPKFWYKLEQNGTGLKIQIADRAAAGFVPSPAHMDRGDGKGERDVVYIGRYHCAGDTYKSETKKAQWRNMTRSNGRTIIQKIGTGYYMFDFATRFTIWLLYLVEFADWNCQNTIGYGGSSGNYFENSGTTDEMNYHTGTTTGERTQFGHTQYRNIEGLWDNCYDIIDGCYNSSNGLNIILNPSEYSDSAGGVSVGTPSDGIPSAFNVSNAAGFPMFYPTAAGGSNTTYSCDFWGFNKSAPVIYVSGNAYIANLNRGLFGSGSFGAGEGNGNVGTRLMELT